MPPSAVRKLKLRVADFFSGGGGSSLGFTAAGYRVVLGIDTNDKARHCFQKNHPHAKVLATSVANTDAMVRALAEANVDVATVSAPCQGFSPAGHQRSDDVRNSLTLAAAHVFAQALTPIVIFENVPQVAKSGAWADASKVLRDAGYTISSANLDACNFGVPQRRVRFFAVATLDGYAFNFAAAAAVASKQPRTAVCDVFPERSHFFHFGRGKNDKCVYTSAHESPPLRCNCSYFPKGDFRKRPSDDASIDQCQPWTKRELATLQGWPTSSHLPAKKRDAARIIGNSVCPPVAEFIASLAAAPFSHANAVARMANCIRTEGDLHVFKVQAAKRGWGHSREQQLIEAQDKAVEGAHTGPLPGSRVKQWIQMHNRVPDVDAAPSEAVHVAQLQRRERRRLTQLLQSHVQSDGTLRDLRDPIWSAPPIGAPPSSSNPAAHWGNKPWRLGDTSDVPTHCLPVAQHYERFQVIHMGHCERCQAHSKKVHGCAPPLDALRSAHSTGVIPDTTAWTLDPTCYQAEMIEEIRIGLNPPVDSSLQPTEVPNGKTCWDEWGAAMEYMDKMDAIAAFSEGHWKLPKGAVCSALHMVSRSADLRAFERDGTPYDVRSVLDLTKSGVNRALPRWRFRMPGVDEAVALVGRFPNGYLGTTDLSKYFPSCSLGPGLAKVCWIRDPRADTVWRGSGPPSAEWLAWQAARRASGKRYPPYRRCVGMPLGVTVAPAFACGISGEMIQFLTAIGLNCSMYVDDAIFAAATAEQCAADMDTAESVFSWLGLRVNKKKRTGPCRRLKYLGLIIDTVSRTVSIDNERRLDLLSVMTRLRAHGKCGTSDLDTLIGKLGFTAGVLRGGKAFLHRLRSCWSRADSSSSSVAHIDSDGLLDVEWWIDKLSSPVQGSRIFMTDSPLPVVTLKSDAAGEIGWGYVVDGVLHWSRWLPETVTKHHIQYKELVALVHCMQEYGELLANRIVRFGVDNSGVCYAANKLSSRCPTLMTLLRQLANAQCDHNADAIAVHVSRRFNELADLATRFQVLEEFAQYLPDDIACPVAGQTQTCRVASPADNAPVYKIRHHARGATASTPPPCCSTTLASPSSTASATPWACHAASSTSKSPCSTSGTSPASPASTNCEHGQRSPSTTPPSGTALSTAACATPAAAPESASRSSSTGSRSATRTRPSSSSRCSSATSSASPPASASAPTATSTGATCATWCSGLASSPPTRRVSGQSGTPSACKCATSTAAGGALSSRSGAVARSVSSSTARVSSRCRTTTTTGVPATCSASSSAACTATLAAPPACFQPSTATAPSGSTPTTGAACACAWSACRARSASRAASAAAASAPAAQRTTSPWARRDSSCSIKATGSRTRSCATTAPNRDLASTSPTCTRGAYGHSSERRLRVGGGHAATMLEQRQPRWGGARPPLPGNKTRVLHSAWGHRATCARKPSPPLGGGALNLPTALRRR